MKRLVILAVVLLSLTIGYQSGVSIGGPEPVEETPYIPMQQVVSVDPVATKPEDIYPLSQADIELIALVTMAEAESESELGKRLVIDTILNRMDGSNDSARNVIYQKGQFSSMWNGRVERCEVREDIVSLVKEELLDRTNYDVWFFRTQRYSSYGTALFKEGNHYFSKR